MYTRFCYNAFTKRCLPAASVDNLIGASRCQGTIGPRFTFAAEEVRQRPTAFGARRLVRSKVADPPSIRTGGQRCERTKKILSRSPRAGRSMPGGAPLHFFRFVCYRLRESSKSPQLNLCPHPSLTPPKAPPRFRLPRTRFDAARRRCRGCAGRLREWPLPAPCRRPSPVRRGNLQAPPPGCALVRPRR